MNARRAFTVRQLARVSLHKAKTLKLIQQDLMFVHVAKRAKSKRPAFAELYEIAASQGGYFTLAQAKSAGYSAPLLQHHLATDRIERTRRGIFRLVHFPPGDNEDLIVAWLWSRQEGVFSHESALRLHGLADVLPASKHLTLPAPWARRRLKIPPGLALYFRTLEESEITWLGAIPLTTPLRTLVDCVRANAAPDLIAEARRQAIRRGLVSRARLNRALKRACPRISS